MHHRFTWFATHSTSWQSIWLFIEFTCSACPCASHTIASVSFLRCPPFNQCHVLSVLTFSVSFRNLPRRGFSSHWLIFSSFKCLLNASGSSTSDNPFFAATNFNIHSSLSLRYLFKLCTFTFTHPRKPSSSFFFLQDTIYLHFFSDVYAHSWSLTF